MHSTRACWTRASSERRGRALRQQSSHRGSYAVDIAGSHRGPVSSNARPSEGSVHCSQASSNRRGPTWSERWRCCRSDAASRSRSPLFQASDNSKLTATTDDNATPLL